MKLRACSGNRQKQEQTRRGKAADAREGAEQETALHLHVSTSQLAPASSASFAPNGVTRLQLANGGGATRTCTMHRARGWRWRRRRRQDSTTKTSALRVQHEERTADSDAISYHQIDQRLAIISSTQSTHPSHHSIRWPQAQHHVTTNGAMNRPFTKSSYEMGGVHV